MSAVECCEPTKQVTRTKRLMQTQLLLSPVHEGVMSRKPQQQRKCSPVKAARVEEPADPKPQKSQKPQKPAAPAKGRGRRSRSCDTAHGQSAKTLTKAVSLENFFPVQRRSERRFMKQQAEESESRMLQRLLTNSQEGLKVVQIEGKGRGVVCTRRFAKDELVVEYKGDMIDYRTAKAREEAYNADPSVGCYMYFFMLRDAKMCVDATAESPHFGRLLNHSRLKPNCYTKVVSVEGEPHLCLFAKRDVCPGEELLYDYGDRDPATLAAHPWLKT